MKTLKLAAIIAATVAAPFVSHAQNSVWLPAPGSGSVSVSYLSQDADRFYIGSSLMSLPFGTIKLNTTTLAAKPNSREEKYKVLLPVTDGRIRKR